MSVGSQLFGTIARQISLAMLVLACAAVIAIVVGLNSLSRYATMTGEAQSAWRRVVHAERMNALVNATVMDSRGIYMSRNREEVEGFAVALLHSLSEMRTLVDMWRLQIDAEDRDAFERVEAAIMGFVRFREELVNVGRNLSPAAADAMGNSIPNRNSRIALSQALREISDINDLRNHAIAERLSALQTKSFQYQMTFGILSIGAGLVLAFAILRWRVTQPLRTLANTMRSLSTFQHSAEVPFATRSDEIGDMARSVVIFRDHAEARVVLERQAANEAEARARRQERREALTHQFGDRLEAVIEAVGAGVSEMQETARSLAQGAVSTGRRAGAASQSSLAASKNVHVMAAAAEEISISISDIAVRIERTSSVVREAEHEITQANAAVAKLADAAGRVSEILALIREFAAQTSLLALNATIEAARAGEAGRGFSIVAAEVKSLSSRTAQATDDIAEQVAVFDQRVKQVVTAMQAATRVMDEVSEHTIAIVATTSQQSAATSEIAANAQVTASSTALVVDQMQYVTAATETAIAETARSLDAAERVEREAKALRQELQTFFCNLKAA